MNATDSKICLYSAQKFDQICEHISIILGHGSDPKALSPALKDDIISEAQQAIEQWK
jgi:hypothetical protein